MDVSYILWIHISSVQPLSHVWLQPYGLQHARLPCPSSTPKLAQTHVHCVSDSIQPSHALLSPSPAFNLSLASGSFPMSQLFAQGGQNIGASASVLPSVLKIVIYICFFLFSSIFFKLKEFSHLNLWSSRNDFSVWCEFPFLFYVFIYLFFLF